ncbi:ThiF family adenylyltransferase [Tumebacillus sp. DT12]|uniref:ThiF family adenylyltransferase n=1 Tax=Tumebacillus lacus TaxID=2995335 RepID=A0ABT3X3D4_9BACL|nr:ThiF family adenylyltransferase [Tumebacillus lacus]MCX7569254.1 ThiF family adenylyltransferase [Tumebacillus lacus]
MQPTFKPILKPLMRNGDVLRIGFEREVYELEDADGAIERFLTALDGTLSIEEIAALHDLSTDEVRDALATFDELGFLDDKSAVSDRMTDRDRERYRANLTYYSNFSKLEHSPAVYQQRVQDATVAVLGLGGASLIAAALAGLGVGKIIGLDCDQVELSNLNRQFVFREDDIGKLKTDAVAEHLHRLNRDIEVVTHNQLVTSAASLLPVLEGADLVVNMIDTPSLISARWVNSACVHLGLPVLLGGIGNNRVMYQRFVPHEHGCYDCFLIHCLQLDQTGELELRALYGQVFENRNTAMAPHVAMLSGFISTEVSKHFAGYASPMPPSSSVELDLITMELKHSGPWQRYAECPTCGEARHAREDIEPVELDALITIAKERMMQR